MIAISLVVAVVASFQGIAAATVNENVVKAADGRSETPIVSTDMFGEPHGEYFTDFAYVSKGHRRVTTIHMLGCGAHEHLEEIGLHYEALSPPWVSNAIAQHGKSKATESMMLLETNEYIKQIDLWTYRAPIGWGKKRTRIGSMKLTASDGTTLTCGANNSQDPTVSWHFKDHAFLYFEGYAGEAIDALTAKFIPVTKYFA